MSTLIIPHINPVKYVLNPYSNDPKYYSKLLDDYRYPDTVKDWETPAKYWQPWQQNDTIKQQFQSSFTTITLKLRTCYGGLVLSQDFTKGLQNASNPSLYIFEHSLSLASVDPGVYFIELKCVGSTTVYFYSEVLKVQATWENSLLLTYSNYRFYSDWIFETGTLPSIRVLGSIRYKSPASKDTFYEDQTLDLKILHSVPYRLWEMVVGGSYGIPDYLIDKLNRVLGCSSLSIDGKGFVKADSAKLEEIAAEDYPLKAWSIDLRESVNKQSFTYGDDSVDVVIKDTVPPFINGEVYTIGNNQIFFPFSEPVTGTTAGWRIIMDGAIFPLTPTSFTGTNNRIATLPTVFNWQTVLTWQYVPASGDTTDYNQNKMDPPYSGSITNKLSAPAMTLSTPAFTFVAASDTEIQGDWTTVTNAANYVEQYADNSDFIGAITVYNSTGLSNLINSLMPATTYWGRVRAENAAGGFAPSPWNVKQATTLDNQTLPPEFNTVLTFVSSRKDEAFSVHGAARVTGDNIEFHFNKIINAQGTHKKMFLYLDGIIMLVIDFADNYMGRGFVFIKDGIKYYSDFEEGNIYF